MKVKVAWLLRSDGDTVAGSIKTSSEVPLYSFNAGLGDAVFFRTCPRLVRVRGVYRLQPVKPGLKRPELVNPECRKNLYN